MNDKLSKKMDELLATSDERREVAERVRETRGIMAFVEALGGIDLDGDWCWADVSRRVADLIDPTCEMVVKNGHACCGKCGHRLAGECEVEEDYYEFRPFCPDCGARVVSNDD